jgi:ABC-2 type transport system ATP-binding protein
MPSAASEPAILVTGLEKHYGSTHAVDGLTFDVAPGEVFGLLGPNGAGKTTTVEILEGYRQADAGTVRVLGLDPWRDGARLRPRIGVMLQEGGLYPGLQPLELLRLFAAYYDGPEDPAKLLDTVGLRDAIHNTVRRLSGGQRQRLSLACALIGNPSVVFLDEPTAGMDPRARATTWQLVRDLAQRGATVLLTTHAMDEAEQLCDRAAIVNSGRLAALGSPAELTRRGTAEEIRITTSSRVDVPALASALCVNESDVLKQRSGEYIARAAGTPARIADLASFLRDHNVTLISLQVGHSSLEEVFLRLTAEDTT